MVIYKYPLDHMGILEIQMPKVARLLACQVQDGTPMVWAAVDTTSPTITRRILCVPTGAPFELPVAEASHTGEWAYLATYQDEGFVGHVFYEDQEGEYE